MYIYQIAFKENKRLYTQQGICAALVTTNAQGRSVATILFTGIPSSFI